MTERHRKREKERERERERERASVASSPSGYSTMNVMFGFRITPLVPLAVNAWQKVYSIAQSLKIYSKLYLICAHSYK